MDLRDDLAELAQRITAGVPPAYIRYVEATPAESLLEQGFDPKTLLVLNLELKGIDSAPEHRNRFFLTGDGCGNYYFVDSRRDPDKVMLWAHDPEGIEDPKVRLDEFLPTAEQTNRIDCVLKPGALYICRTERYGESILNPIALDEWVAAIEATDGIEYRGYREVPHPFKKEVFRVELPGRAVETASGADREVSLYQGRILLADSEGGRELAEALANYLNASVLRATAD